MNRTSFIRSFISGIVALPVLGVKNPLEAEPDLEPDTYYCDECDTPVSRGERECALCTGCSECGDWPCQVCGGCYYCCRTENCKGDDCPYDYI